MDIYRHCLSDLDRPILRSLLYTFFCRLAFNCFSINVGIHQLASGESAFRGKYSAGESGLGHRLITAGHESCPLKWPVAARNRGEQ
jgi:hypothetical protein